MSEVTEEKIAKRRYAKEFFDPIADVCRKYIPDIPMRKETEQVVEEMALTVKRSNCNRREYMN